MIVTLDAFSGRPNPSWNVSEEDRRQLVDRVANRALKAADAVDDVLGYRGLIVSAERDDEVPEGFPASFRVGGELPSGYTQPEIQGVCALG